MWWLLMCVALVGQTKACSCEDSLLNQLNNQLNKVNELIRLIQTKSDSKIINHYDYLPTMQRAKAALDYSEKIHQQFDKENSLEQKNQWTKLPNTRRNMFQDGEWKKDFYEALSTVLQKELKQQPGVRENLGDNFNALKLISKT